MIDSPGIFDISPEEYHADPCMPLSASCSVLQMIDTQSPMHAMWNHPKLRPGQIEEESSKFDVGTAFHTMMTGNGAEIIPVNAPDFRTKAAREARNVIRAQGKTPVKIDDYETLQRMKQETEIQLAAHEGSYVNTQAEFEKSLIWKEDEFWFRCRPDVLDVTKNLMWDFKTTETSVAPHAFQNHLFRSQYDFRAAYYARGYKEITGTPLSEYRFIPVEVEPPHALAIFSLTPEAMEFAAKRVDRAIDIWKTCLARNEWPGYSNKVYYITPPKWQENRQIEREIAEEYSDEKALGKSIEAGMA